MRESPLGIVNPELAIRAIVNACQRVRCDLHKTGKARFDVIAAAEEQEARHWVVLMPAGTGDALVA